MLHSIAGFIQKMLKGNLKVWQQIVIRFRVNILIILSCKFYICFRNTSKHVLCLTYKHFSFLDLCCLSWTFHVKLTTCS